MKKRIDREQEGVYHKSNRHEMRTDHTGLGAGRNIFLENSGLADQLLAARGNAVGCGRLAAGWT